MVIPFYMLKIEYLFGVTGSDPYPYEYIIPLSLLKVKKNLLVFVTAVETDPGEIGRIP